MHNRARVQRPKKFYFSNRVMDFVNNEGSQQLKENVFIDNVCLYILIVADHKVYELCIAFDFFAISMLTIYRKKKTYIYSYFGQDLKKNHYITSF